MKRVAVAGASSPIGQALAKANGIEWMGLSRRGEGPFYSSWRTCDLFSLKDAEDGLAGVDAAIFVIHATGRSARLVQGTQKDLDFIMLDNFLRAARKNGVTEIGVVRDDVIVQSTLSADLQVALEKAIGARGARARRDAPTGVRSVQRMKLPAGRDAEWVAMEYMRWLPRVRGVQVEVTDARVCRFYAGPVRVRPLLELTYSAERSTPDRALFYITGGLLVRPSKRARIEFREDAHEVIVAIHDFEPRLPWHLYRGSQALAHLAVMSLFARHLKNQR